ncbi:hypothetical protein ACO2Q3_13695 [Caulobacter sp. KR2-114]|uniref:hypothetical protein n=1 Tax=Caulobacter sp. KR2-114 TaxID=3400912 RepID=UPI003C0E0B6E
MNLGLEDIMRSGRTLWLAGVGAGALITALASSANAADVNITNTSTITGELSATTTGADRITIINDGAVDNAAGPAIVAIADQGAVAVTNNGVITASQDGILATTNSKDGVSITLNAGLTAGTGEGAEATDKGSGAATVTVASGTSKAPLMIAAGAGAATAGVVSVSYFGAATTTLGDHVSISNGGPGVGGSADAAAVAVLTAADTAGPSASVVAGKSDSFVLQGNASAAIAAHVGIGGSVGPNGTASASATVGDNVSIHVSGYTDAGVYVTTTDTTGAGKFAGAGAATAIVGTGTILVDEVGAVGGPSNSKTSVGVGAFSSGGAVVVDDAAQVTVTGGAETSIGLDASTTGAGSSKITARASVTSGTGDGIASTTVNGANTVNVLGGAVLAKGGHGVDARATGTGAVTVTTAAKSSVGTTTPGGFSGIFATSAGGAVSIDAEGAVSDGGIAAATIGGGAVDVTTGGKGLTNSAGVGIKATAAQGAITVTTGGPVTASGQGILASSSGLGAITVDVGGSVTSGGAAAVEGISNDVAVGVGPVTVSTGSGTGAHPIAITNPQGSGVEAITILGAASTTLGDHNVITVGQSGLSGVAGADAIAVVTPLDFTGSPSARTVVGAHDTFVVQGNRGSAVVAQTGLAGQLGPSGTASVAVTVGDDVDIHMSGYSDGGVTGFTFDPSGANKYASKGAVSIVVGTGTIVVDEAGASNPSGGAMINYGVAGGSAGGNVLVDNAAVVTVSGGFDASVGLSALTTAVGSATIGSHASVTSANGDAIHAASDSGAVTVKVTAGKVTATGGDGIDAVANTSGDVTVSTSAGSTVRTLTPGLFSGILARSGSGSVNVDAEGVVADGGILAKTGGLGNVGVTAADNVTNSNGDGVDAFAAGGSATVSVAGPIKASGSGVVAQAAGAATLQASASVTAGGLYALAASSLGSGDATVTTANGADTARINLKGATLAGVAAYSAGGQATASIGDDNTIVAGAPGVARGAGVSAQSLATSGPYSAQVHLGAGDVVIFQGNQSAGASAINQAPTPLQTGGALVSAGTGFRIHVSGYDSAGVYASTVDTSGANAYFGAGDVTVTLASGQITVDEAGATGTAAGAATNVGVGAFTLGGNVYVNSAADVTVSGGADSTVGLSTYTQGPGSSTLISTGNVVSRQGDGLLARTGDGPDEIEVNGGSVSAPQGAAVDAVATGLGGINISISGGATVSGQTGISATTAGSVGIDNGSFVKGGAGGGIVLNTPASAIVGNLSGAVLTAPGSDTAPTIAMRGAGSLIVANFGTVTSNRSGHDGLVVVAGTGGLTIDNTPSGVFDGRFTAADNAYVQNDGLWLTRGTSNFGTTAGGASNTFVNFNTLQVGLTGPAAAASTTSFVNVGHFNNGGFGSTGVVSMVNGKEGDVFNVSGLFTGAPGESVLALDAFLGGPGSKADQLRLSSGSAGQTLIRINDTNTGDGALNAKGIVLVQGATAAGDFILDPSQPNYDPALHGIQHGLFVYPLTFSGGNEQLIGVPGLPAAQFATMASAAEQVWSSTSPGADAADNLRFSLSGSAEAPRVWGKALNWGASRLAAGQLSLGADGAWNSLQAGGDRPMSTSVSQSASVNAFGQTFGFNTSYSQSTSALVTGFDLGRRVGQDSAWSWGLTTGYVESQQSFAQGSSAALYGGAMVAAHGAYVTRGGFYLSGDVKMTALKVTYLTAWAGMGRQTGAITTFGGEAQAGWRRALTGTWTVQPEASLAVQSSRLGTLVVSDTPLAFGQASSARVSVGARLDGAWTLGGWSLKSSTSLKGVDELQDANTLRLQAVDTGYVLPDQIGGAFADLGQSLSLDSRDGKVSAFVSGAYRVRPGYQAAQGAVGLRLRW